MNRPSRTCAAAALIVAYGLAGGAQTPVPSPPASPMPPTRLQTRWASPVTPDRVLPEALTGAARAALRPGKNTFAVHAHQTRGGQFIDVGLVDVIDPAPARR